MIPACGSSAFRTALMSDWAAAALPSSIFLPAATCPWRMQDRSVCITYNGEIYNFAELRRELEGKGYRFVSDTDTEVVLHLYEEEGPECVTRLNGMFAFAICDTRSGTPVRLRCPGSFWSKAVLLLVSRPTDGLRVGGQGAAGGPWNQRRTRSAITASVPDVFVGA